MIKQVAVCDVCPNEAEMVYHVVNNKDIVPPGWFYVTEAYNQPTGSYRVATYIMCSLNCVVAKYQGWLHREQGRLR